MIAIVTSSIFPSTTPLKCGQARTVFSCTERLAQTQETIRSLLDLGIESIFLFDNSGKNWEPGTEQFIKPAVLHLSDSYIYENKGVSELQMLLHGIDQIPDGEPLIKISGRYMLKRLAVLDSNDWELAGRPYWKGSRIENISTRAYYVRRRSVYKRLLEDAIREVFAYPGRVVGFRSFLRVAQNAIKPNLSFPYEDPHFAIENALATLVNRKKYKFLPLARLHVEGLFGNFSPHDYISE